MPSKFKEEPYSARAIAEPKRPIISTTGKVRSNPVEPISAPDLNEVQEEQQILNNNAFLRQYLYHDSLNNVVLNENKETATYHVVPGTEDKANWQKGEESIIQLDKIKSNTSKENQPSVNAGVSTVPVGDEDDKKQADRFQSLVIDDDDLLMKDEGDDKESISSEDNGSDELGEADEKKQAAAMQSMMKQEDNMIQYQEDDDSPGNNSTLEAARPSNNTNSKDSINNMINNSLTSPKKLRGKPTSYYSSGVALNINPNETVSGKAHENPSLDSTGVSLNISVDDHGAINQWLMKNHQDSSNSSSSNGSLTTEKSEQNGSGIEETSSTSLLPQNEITGGELVSKVSTSQSKGDKGKTVSYHSTRPGNAKSSADSNAVEGSTSVSNIHHVISPAVITLPKTSSRPVKFVFHVKDMKSKEMSADESEGKSKAYQSALVGNDVTQRLNDDGKVQYFLGYSSRFNGLFSPISLKFPYKSHSPKAGFLTDNLNLRFYLFK